MRVWILGAKGLLGECLHQMCDARKIACLATAKQEADICDKGALQSVASAFRPTHIINCAAYTNVDRAESELKLAYDINVWGSENIGLVANASHAKLVHISTDYVFDGAGSRPCLEEDACIPIGAYAKSKREGEIRLLEVMPQACIIRTSWLFGHKGKNFISSILTQLQEKEEVRVVSDQRGRPTYVKDLADAVLSSMCHTGIYHFANRGELSRFEMAQDILEEARALGLKVACKRIVPVLSSEFPSAARRPAYSVLSTLKIERLLGKAPRAWKEVLKEYISDVK